MKSIDQFMKILMKNITCLNKWLRVLHISFEKYKIGPFL